RMVGISLGRILQMLASQVGGTYLVHSDFVEITTPERTRPEEWVSCRRDLAPLVSANFDKRPLGRALSELAALSGINVVVDARISAKSAETPVTACLNATPIDSAVRLLADMADLAPVAIDNVIYVTSKTNAQALQAEQERRRLLKPDAKPAINAFLDQPKP